MEYSTTAEHNTIMKKPSEDSVQEMLELVQRQQVHDGDFRGRVFNPLPAIGTKRGPSIGALNGTGKNKTKSNARHVQPKLERESTIFDLKQSRSNNIGPNLSTDNLDISPKLKGDQNVLKCKSKGKPAPRVPYAMRREGTNYHLPPLSSFQMQDICDIERPSAPSPLSKEFYTHEEGINIDLSSNNNNQYAKYAELCDGSSTYDTNTGYFQHTNNGGQERLLPWSATEAMDNEEGGAQEQDQPYERPKTARGRRRDEREVIERSTPRSRCSSASVDTGMITERPKTARSRRFVDGDSSDARPRTRGRRREISEQDAYEPYERPKTARGGGRRRGEQGEVSEDEPSEIQRALRKPRPKSPGPHHPRYRMVNTNSRSSYGEFDENGIIDNVAVMNSAT